MAGAVVGCSQVRDQQRFQLGTSTIRKPAFHRVILAQCGATLVACLIGSLFGWTSAYSAMLGGMISAIPNGYFAAMVFAHQGAQAAPKIVRSFYRGEAVKLGLTATMFCLVFILVKPLGVAALFSAFLTVQMAGWWSSATLTTVGPKRDALR